MKCYKDIPESIKRKRDSWNQARIPWLVAAQQAEGYYYNNMGGTGTNFNKQQLDFVQRTTGISVSINRLHPAANQKLAMLVQSKPSHKVISLDKRYKDVALVLDKMKHAVMYNSKADIQTEEAVKNMIISGMGMEAGLPTDQFTGGEFNVATKHLHYSTVILDANAKDRSLDDMEGFFIEKEITLDKAKAIYGEFVIDENGNKIPLEQLAGSGVVQTSTPSDHASVVTYAYDAQKIKVTEYYDKVFTTMYLIQTADGDIQRAFIENDPDIRLLVTGNTDKEQGLFVRRALLLNDKMVDVTIMPLTRFPIAVYFYEWGGSPYNSFGMIHFSRGAQEATDKLFQLFILNGILSNNKGWKSPVGAIPPEMKQLWQDYANNPLVVKEYIPQVIEGQVFIPEQEQVQQLSSFFPMVLEMLKDSINDSTGISPILAGNAKDAKVDVFQSLQQYQTAAMQRVILSTIHINQVKEQLGNVIIELLIANLKPGDHYAFFDQEGDLNELEIAQTIDAIKTTRFKVLSVAGESSPTRDLTVASELFKVAQSTPNEIERSIFTNKALKLSGSKEVEDIVEETNVAKQQQQQIEGLEQEIKRKDEIVKQFQNQALHAETSLEAEKAKTEIQVAKVKAEYEIEIEKLQIQLQEARHPKEENKK